MFMKVKGNNEMYDDDNEKDQKKLAEIVKKHQDANKFGYWVEASKELNKEFEDNANSEAWRSRYRRLDDEYNQKVVVINHKYVHNDDLEDRLLSYIKKERTLEFLQDKLDMEEIELLGYITKLQRDGREINLLGDKVSLSKSLPVENRTFELYNGDLESLNLCVVSDTHLCNKKQQLTLLNNVYDECVKRGITTVLHCGDITDGMSKRQQQIYELFMFGADEQAEYVINNYPKRDGITTYFITGNHDGWSFQSAGVDVGKIIAASRPDMIYLGNQKARVKMNNVNIDLFHPIDGSSYAVSYSGQKTIESMPSGTKPDIMFCGHHHKSCSFVFNDVYYNEVPCLEDRTQFEEGKKLINTVGAMFPTIKTDENGDLISFTPETMIFKNMIEMDYDMPNRKDYKKVITIKRG